jgi:uncharacterized protein (DUF1810 family)
MSTEKHLNRFLEAQQHVYLKALEEIKNGRKTSHWMWFIFPQIKGLGKSDTAEFYAIESLKEATDYLRDPVLGKRLVEITAELLYLEDHDATAIFGAPDDMKLRSSLTLFSLVSNANPVFEQAIDLYFDGNRDEHTMELLGF